ncbi:MAG: segregation/condensation protein A [Alphaproteobacteria bacterium]|nr:segregation/condensation protein A [Alphaproteobacteria bacterium]
MSETIDVELTAAGDADADEALVLALDGFEGPLHLLLELTRARKVDITRISVAELAEQYLAFIENAQAQRIDLAADYLVMAAWLAYLKSRLLLPRPGVAEDEPSPEALEAALKLKLQRLAQARAAVEKLWALPQLGRDVFAFGQPQHVDVTRVPAWKAEFSDLLQSYCVQRAKHYRRTHKLTPRKAYPLADARERLEMLLRDMPDWKTLDALTPPAAGGPAAPPRESYLASLFGAALELAREGGMELRQTEAFAPLFLRAKTAEQP